MLERSLALACVLATAGCASNTLRYAGADRPAIGGGYREAAQISWTCDRQDPEAGGGAIIGALTGIAVDTALGAISELLKRAEEGRTGTWTAARADALTACPGGIGTLTLVRGLYEGDSGALLDGQAGPGGKAVYPAFRLTAQLAFTPRPGGAGDFDVRVTPIRLDYAETAARSRGSGRKEVIVTLAIAASDEGTAATDADKAAGSGGGTVLNLGRLEVGKTYQKFDTSGAVVVKASALQNILVIVTESENPSIALAALNAAFADNKDDLGAALKGAIEDAIGNDK